jgi:hypothetical protein
MTVTLPRLDADTTRLALSISCLGLSNTSSTLSDCDHCRDFNYIIKAPIRHFTPSLGWRVRSGHKSRSVIRALYGADIGLDWTI